MHATNGRQRRHSPPLSASEKRHISFKLTTQVPDKLRRAKILHHSSATSKSLIQVVFSSTCLVSSNERDDYLPIVQDLQMQGKAGLRYKCSSNHPSFMAFQQIEREVKDESFLLVRPIRLRTECDFLLPGGSELSWWWRVRVMPDHSSHN
ncbi:hypothetical protein GALMADRAFT_1262965 [Galerina marginata CBS 339.88]|uniref:Uncharacterized protein n=1 Tax=Galerina marginata (strain CBS 339.88) TaxID=685588 RepID=A0A067T658_GALM3|nr:hypothetical protein GALMADRAFT_1262965 [Galerina marginata CBS 339.88]